MDRKEFLSLMGVAAGGFLLASYLDGCSKTSSTPLSVDFTLDLAAPANSVLNNNGGYIVTQGIIVAKTVAGNYIAVAAVCTHEGQTIYYDSVNDRFHCSAHGSNFSDTGSVINGPAKNALQQFNTALNGTNLRIYS
jgi:cytochrome b6-f complex iron-sulfur subunit